MRPEEADRGFGPGTPTGGRARSFGPARVILVIEDNLDSRESLQQILQIGGHTVHVADNGQAGIEAAGRLKPDVAVIDIGLPGMDGYEVARILRQQVPPSLEGGSGGSGAAPSVPVGEGDAAAQEDAPRFGAASRTPGRMTLIALTGFDDAGRAEAAGFDAHLIKPVDLDHLRRLIFGASIVPRRDSDS
jgi:CheY-like chemotaxis protein